MHSVADPGIAVTNIARSLPPLLVSLYQCVASLFLADAWEASETPAWLALCCEPQRGHFVRSARTDWPRHSDGGESAGKLAERGVRWARELGYPVDGVEVR